MNKEDYIKLIEDAKNTISTGEVKTISVKSFGSFFRKVYVENIYKFLKELKDKNIVIYFEAEGKYSTDYDERRDKEDAALLLEYINNYIRIR